jgi:hypothetical protein
MSEDKFQTYRRTTLAELRPYEPGEDLSGVTINPADEAAGSPREGDMIARNPANREDMWLVAKAYFEQNFTPT